MRKVNKLTGRSRKGGWFYSDEGKEQLRKAGMEAHKRSQQALIEQVGEWHKMRVPLTHEAAKVMKSIKGFIPKLKFLNAAMEAEINLSKKEG